MILIRVDLGTPVTVRGTLTDENGAPLPGATVTARALSNAGGAEVDLGTATDEGAGVYSVVFDAASSGSWAVRMEAAAPDKATAEGTVFVRETRFS